MDGERDEMNPARRRRALLTAILASAVLVGGIAIASRGGEPSSTADTASTVPRIVSFPASEMGTVPLETTPVDTAVPESAAATVQTPLPTVSAQAYAVYDVSSQRWLAAQRADEQRAVGSVMKLLTAKVVLDTGDLTKEVTIGDLDIGALESNIGLYAGEVLPRDVLFRAMLIVSANDAARALAIDIGGSTQAFVDRMNQAAQALGLTNTMASNPVGLDGGGGHSSAHDLIMLAADLMTDQTFREAVAKPSATLHKQTFASTNPLLGAYPGATGVKTGHTTDAGYCLVASATRDGRTMMVAVLGSTSETSRGDDAAALLDWAFAND
jgi:serine-type D-Ala-D-Ala carboxypeptidase (penicillin-binding protein 5/6)